MLVEWQAPLLSQQPLGAARRAHAAAPAAHLARAAGAAAPSAVVAVGLLVHALGGVAEGLAAAARDRAVITVAARGAASLRGSGAVRVARCAAVVRITVEHARGAAGVRSRVADVPARRAARARRGRVRGRRALAARRADYRSCSDRCWPRTMAPLPVPQRWSLALHVNPQTPPAEQVAVPPVTAGHCVAHPPQWVGSVCSFTHEAPHRLRPVPQTEVHVKALAPVVEQ